MADKTTPADQFVQYLDENGHGFHFAVAARINELSREGKSRWQVVNTDFPVSVNGIDYHIDILLEGQRGAYMIIECKRVNPAYGSWAFIQATHHDSQSPRQAIFETVLTSDHGIRRSIRSEIVTSPAYDLGAVLREKREGNKGNTAPKALDDAVTQVLRGTSGVANHLMHEWSGRASKQRILLPVIVTTANLWGCNENIARANLANGKINPEAVKLSEVGRLWYFHNRSRSMRSDVRSSDRGVNMSEWLRYESTRTIGIVNQAFLDELLTSDFEEWLAY